GAEQLANVLPYPNKVAVVYMSGTELAEALEAASQGLPYTDDTAATCAAFMQVSGLKYTVDTTVPYDKGEAYGDNWFKAASLGRVTIEEVCGKPFEAEATYAVITSNANFNGMDSSYVFKAAAQANERSTITTAVVRDVIWMYISEEFGNVIDETYAEAQGRITIR
ncbi:MAG: 5'-nucleotidase C-terminal domain-containing protein, partial [Clostridia bacterium]|nr:5'-nucleotidase C-terminal domain-containing protein [Clostridia bacterium]